MKRKVYFILITIENIEGASSEEKNETAYTYNRNEEPVPNCCSKFCLDLSLCIKKRFLHIIRDIKTFMMEILCPIILVLIGLGVSSVEFFRDSPPKTMTMSKFKAEQFPKVNKIPLLQNKSDIDSSFLLNYDTNITKYNLIDWNISYDNVTKSLVEYNRMLQFSNTNLTQYGNFFFLRLDTIRHNYDFILISNTFAADAPPIYAQEMLTNIIRKASNNPNFKIKV